MAIQQKIIPHLWFDNHAEEAVAFYVSIFKDARVVMKAMLAMKKIDIRRLKEAYEGR
jgi:predicted 3-demethylubiquinone-9 3-methyltransferase (glyoxalase superfamily)